MLERIKKACWITTNAFDDELLSLAKAAINDLRIAGVYVPSLNALNLNTDALVIRAVITYVRLHFGTPNDYDKLKASYDEQKAQLVSSSEWGGLDGSCECN